MPIYEYRCQHCGEFEEMQRITDPALERCPKCRRKVRRLISSTSFQLKGSGWYVTDYARAGSGNGKTKDEGKGKDADSASGSSGSAAAKADAKSESKTDAKSESKAAPATSSEKPAS